MNTNKNSKPKIYFIPSYIGSLKYYARILPFLQDKYDVRFLLLKKRETREDLIEYCKKKNFHLEILGDMAKGFRIPFLSPIIKRYKFIKKYREFLAEKQPVKIIYLWNMGQISNFIREANRMGIETMLLQISFFGGSYKDFNKIKNGITSLDSFIYRWYHSVLSFFYRFLDPIFLGLNYITLSEEPKKVGAGGVESAKDMAKTFISSKIHNVGMVDFQVVGDLQKQINSNSGFKEKLAKKHNINLNKLNILFLTQHFFLAVKLVTDKELAEFFYKRFKNVRSIFSSQEADVLFKLHPGEKNRYQACEEDGAKIYNDEFLTEELVCLSDLCILDQWTGANCIVLASNKPAIFINLPPMQSSKASLEYYHIKRTVDDEKEFLEALKQFKQGGLEKQYDNSYIDTKSIEKIVSFIEE